MYLRLQIENFRLFAALRTTRGKPRGPVVLVDAEGRVAELNQSAQARELCPGMTMARALSRCGDVTVLHADPVAERTAKRLLWNAAWQVSPQIELGEGALEGIATLELVRPDLAKLTAQVPRLLQRLRRCGLPARAGMAATPDWAGLAATTAERFRLKILPNPERVRELLAHLPLASLDSLSAEACRILEGWGIRSLAGVAALPRQDLGERLGPAGLQAWDILNGTTRRVLQFRELAPDYREDFDLEEAVQDLSALRFLLQRAVEGLARQLEQSGKMARALSLDLWIEGGRDHRKTIRLPEPTRRPDLMERLLGNHLEQIQLTAPVAKGRVVVDPVDPLSRQAGLFERSVRNPWRLQETLDQLAGLLGSENFGVLRLGDSHRPDDYRLMPLPAEPQTDDPASLAGAAGGPPVSGPAFAPNPPSAAARGLWRTSKGGMPTGHIAHRPPGENALPSTGAASGPPRMGPPMRRFRPPLPATVLLEWDRPAHLDCPLVSGRVQASHGPYAASGDWAEARPWAYLEWDVAIEAAGVFSLRRSGENWQLIGAYD
jgi:protein ImuB